jgi:ribulose 1,5-bisphosphate synthetase/thiazole synthase
MVRRCAVSDAAVKSCQRFEESDLSIELSLLLQPVTISLDLAADGVCVIVYVQFSSVGAGMVLGGGFFSSFWDRIWAE